MSLFRTVGALALVCTNVLSPALGGSAAQAGEIASQARSLEGDWQGVFGEKTVRFRFKAEGGSWRGWFVSQRDGSLYPLEKVTISNGVVMFTQASKPQLDFVLEMAADGDALTGVANWPNGAATAHTLKRL